MQNIHVYLGIDPGSTPLTRKSQNHRTGLATIKYKYIKSEIIQVSTEYFRTKNADILNYLKATPCQRIFQTVALIEFK